MITSIRTFTQFDLILNWRQRSVLIATIVMSVVLIGYMSLTSTPINADLITAELRQASTLTLFTIFPIVHIFVSFILPLVLADSFARDHQHEVQELLRALPVSNVAYLAGKSMALLLTALLASLVLLVIAGVAWWVIISPFNIQPVLSAWLVNVSAVACINTVFVALFTVNLKSRRSAFYLSLVSCNQHGEFCWVAFSNLDNALLYHLNPARPVMIDFALQTIIQVSDSADTSLLARLLTLFAGVGEIALLFALQVVRLNRTQ
ncbi:ABC transporter permease subunit [bacterium]|nr:ABC transporter permease subunit [bacterium]